MDLLPPWPLFTAFLAASLVLALTPGPGVIYILARTLSQGRTSGFASVAGVGLGNFGNSVGAALGLAALFAISAAAFTFVKLAGAGYLVWLGIRMLRDARSRIVSELAAVATQPAARVLRDGVLVGLLNPKTTLFFAAFLPQFVNPGGTSPIAQTLALGAVFVAIAACTDALYVVLAGRIAPRVTAHVGFRRWGQRLGGGAFIGLGVLAAVSERPAVR